MKHESLINKSNSNSCAEKNSKTSWIIGLEEDPETGDLILPLPDELLESQGWKIGGSHSRETPLQWTHGFHFPLRLKEIPLFC